MASATLAPITSERHASTSTKRVMRLSLRRRWPACVCDIRHTYRMGLTAAAAAAQAARLTPSSLEATTQPGPVGRGHRRGSTRIDRRRTDAIELRGVPIAGHGVSGVIPGTRPGDSAATLEQAGRDILHAQRRRNRYQPQR